MAIDADAQRAIVEATARTLRPGGSFTTIACVHALPMARARRFRGLFGEVLTTRTVWWNLLPAVTYVCRRPRRTDHELAAVRRRRITTSPTFRWSVAGLAG